jgi:adenosine deaminase CECR1
VRIENCLPYGSDEFGGNAYLLMFRVISQQQYDALDACQKAEFKRLQDLDETEKKGFLESLRLDQSWEGRDEFFQAIGPRLNEIRKNPHIVAEILLKNMEAFGAEGLVYLETQQGLDGAVRPDGTPCTTDEVADIFRTAINSPRGRATGVTVRFQNTVRRFVPEAEQRLRELYAINDRYRDLYVGINMAGREDNDKGYPLRFLEVLRELRRKYPEIRLSVHAGEVDEPNFHVRDTLLLGADRIGHGVNLVTDPDTMLLMRHSPYLVEINLISNLLLEYVDSYDRHPFPEYLRTGIPVSLSTDDRGMWDSNLTDEYFVAVKEFNLSWEELVRMGRNSLEHAFVEEPVKQKLLADYERRVSQFAQRFRRQGLAALSGVKPVNYTFLCTRYSVCFPHE